MTKTPLLRASILALVGCVGSAGPALADAVTYWNNVAQTAVAAGRPGPPGALDNALIHAAMYDAVQSIEKKFKPYHIAVKNASGSPAAAAGAAAYRVLLGFYGATQSATLNAAWDAFLSANPELVGNAGIAVGEEVAAAFVLLRRSTPVPEPTFAGGTAPGEWRPTPNFVGNPPPPTATTMLAPWAGSVPPFTLIRGRQFRVGPPPRMTSRRYLRDYNEVKALGSFANAPCVGCGEFEGVARTADQTTMAYFWSENFFQQWNRALRAITEALSEPLEIADSSRLFALANIAIGDAFITAWDSKLHYNFWRPLTAIRLGDTDPNPDTDPDPTWQPLINNPPYPDYTSGANNVTGAVTRVLALFFDTDEFDFTVTSNAPQLGPTMPPDPRRTRMYHRFSQAADEVVEARILLGIHFRFADVKARRQGERVAEWAFKHFFRPVKHKKHRDRHHWDGDDCDRD